MQNGAGQKEKTGKQNRQIDKMAPDKIKENGWHRISKKIGK